MKSIEATGKDVEEAVQNGLKELGLTQSEVDIKIISKGGWFAKAKVLLTATNDQDDKIEEKIEKNIENEEKNEKNEQKLNEQQFINDSKIASELSLDGDKNEQNVKKIEENSISEENNDTNIEELLQKNINIAQEFLQGLFETLNLDAKILIVESERNVTLQIKTEQANVLIGHRGETLYSLQLLLNTKLGKGSKLCKKILIDVENYRDKQIERIKEKAQNAINTCLRTAKPVSLDFMNAYERFIVHEMVLDDGRVVSESFGNEPRRFVKIFIK